MAGFYPSQNLKQSKKHSSKSLRGVSDHSSIFFEARKSGVFPQWRNIFSNHWFKLQIVLRRNVVPAPSFGTDNEGTVEESTVPLFFYDLLSIIAQNSQLNQHTNV